jgi:hypothetical protein
MTGPETRENLYGSEPEPPSPRGPGLPDQVAGVFTEPAALFRRLRATPVWGWAFTLMMAVNVLVVVLWGARVDVDAFMRPMLEKNPKLTPEMIDQAISGYSRMIIPLGIFQVLFAITAILLLTALILWGLARATAEEGAAATFRQAWSGVVVSGLVNLPKGILLAIICGLRTIGGSRPDQLSPTSLGFYLVPDNVKLHALYCSLDLFTLATLVVTWLMMRHTLRAKVSGAAAAVAVMAFFMVGFPLIFAK